LRETASAPPAALLPRLADASADGLVVCLATGPSLTAADVERCRGRAVVVAVNDAHRLAPWADVLYSSDRYWWAYHKGVPAFGGARATIEYSPGRAPRELEKFCAFVYYRQTGHEGLETAPDGLRTCGQNSGGAALNLAVHLGARRVILLGYDMGDTTGRRHFFGPHPGPINGRHNFPRWRQAFATMVEPLRAAGVEVINCTRTTSLGAFPCVALEEVLA
jgi:hypothetical protein